MQSLLIHSRPGGMGQELTPSEGRTERTFRVCAEVCQLIHYDLLASTKVVAYPCTPGAALAIAGAAGGVVQVVAVAPTFMPGTAGCVYCPPAEASPEPANTDCIPEPLNATPSATIVAVAAKPNTALIRLLRTASNVC